jgi:hypothetical protein
MFAIRRSMLHRLRIDAERLVNAPGLQGGIISDVRVRVRLQKWQSRCNLFILNEQLLMSRPADFFYEIPNLLFLRVGSIYIYDYSLKK